MQTNNAEHQKRHHQALLGPVEHPLGEGMRARLRNDTNGELSQSSSSKRRGQSRSSNNGGIINESFLSLPGQLGDMTIPEDQIIQELPPMARAVSDTLACSPAGSGLRPPSLPPLPPSLRSAPESSPPPPPPHNSTPPPPIPGSQLLRQSRSDSRAAPPSLTRNLSLINNDADPDAVNFASIPKPRLGDRTVSTHVRLRREGFRSTHNQVSFAVRSIRRGSDDWLSLIKPFVADLAFRSLVRRRLQSEVSFRPYNCHAAVLFVDLSSYSRITAAIAHRGAHALSNIVNAYLSRLLKIVNNHGGDCCKFAGDAVLIVWEGDEKELGINVLCAAKCVLEMQEKAGLHPVEGTPLSFRIHCALTCGPLESEIFVAPTHVNMQRLYHAVGGESLAVLSDLVDFAKAGEVCISDECLKHLQVENVSATFKEINGLDDARLLTALHLEPPVLSSIENHIEMEASARLLRRKRVEEDFIHPAVLRLLGHGGLSPTQIAQMRNLCVLFIAMTSNASSVNWLMEVQQVLEKNCCPIVQILDDDKGVHVVAAINLYETVSESSLMGLDVCRELVEQQVGCAIGMATGSTFCGVTGAAGIACRWDITGPPAVRAARLMQYALAQDVAVAIDESVYDDPMAATQMKVLDPAVEIKGSPDPVTIYTISGCRRYDAFRVLETQFGCSAHDSIVNEVEDYINKNGKRSAVVVTGIPLAGKKIVCQQAAGNAGLVPYLHVCDETAGLLQLARTVATWFKYAENDDVRYLANSVLEHMDKSHWSRAHDECLQLVDVALEEGSLSCFLIDRVQFLDEFSLSLIRECLKSKRRALRRGSRSSVSSRADDSESADRLEEPPGKIFFLCVHVSFYNWKSAKDVVEDITRSHRHFTIPIIHVGEASREKLRDLFRGMSDMEVGDRWLDVVSRSSGFSAGYSVERAAAIRRISAKRWSEGKESLAETTDELVLHIPAGLLRTNRILPAQQVSLDVAMRFSQIYDELPPTFQMMSKVLTIASRKGLYRLPRHVLWEVLNDLIAQGVETPVYTIMVNEMTEMNLLKVEDESDEEVLAFQSPALADVAFEVCTPIQRDSIAKALVERLQPLLFKNFRVPLLLADLFLQLGTPHDERVKDLWCDCFKSLEKEPLSTRERQWWLEILRGEIEAAGYSPSTILGDEFCVGEIAKKKVVGIELPLLKIYSAPISFGPMGHTLSVICRNTFHEHGIFHGYDEARTLEVTNATRTATERYVKEVGVVEAFLSRHELPAEEKVLEAERNMIDFLSTPAKSGDGVRAKAAMILEEYIPNFVETRRERLIRLIEKLRMNDNENGVPSVVESAQPAILHAYKTLQGKDRSRSESAQVALMTLATMNWKPRRIPEFLPYVHYQTVARIRNKVLKRLNHEEMLMYRHQQTVDDLEIFLVVTPLLYEAQREWGEVAPCEEEEAEQPQLGFFL